MKYCQKCGAALNDEANFCTKCGEMVAQDNMALSSDGVQEYDDDFDDLYGKKVESLDDHATESNDGSKGVGIAIIIFSVLGLLSSLINVNGLGAFAELVAGSDSLTALSATMMIWSFIPLLWEIPMLIHVIKTIKAKNRFSTGFAVASLLFLNLIAGILMFFYQKNNSKF